MQREKTNASIQSQIRSSLPRNSFNLSIYEETSWGYCAGGEDTLQGPSSEKHILIPAFIISWTLGSWLCGWNAKISGEKDKLWL